MISWCVFIWFNDDQLDCTNVNVHVKTQGYLTLKSSTLLVDIKSPS